MTKRLLNILILLCAAAISLSCSAGLLSEDAAALDGDGTIMISGAVSSDDKPLEGIKMVFEAYGNGPKPIMTMNAYTGSDGIYSIHATGFSGPVTCTVSATDESKTYEDSKSAEINVSWQGSAYDKERNTFVVNDCNFHLNKAQ